MEGGLVHRRLRPSSGGEAVTASPDKQERCSFCYDTPPGPGGCDNFGCPYRNTTSTGDTRPSFAIILTLLAILAGCSSIVDTHTPPPKDWPVLRVVEHRLPHARMRDACSRFGPWYAPVEACTIWRFDLGECHVYFSADFPPQPWIVEHELAHCRGHDHVGDDTARRAWHAYSASVLGRALSTTIRKLQ